MNDFNINLDENVLYEVLITSKYKNVQIKPFGIKIKNNNIILNLFPNKTLLNLKKNNKFLVQFTTNPLLYTKALFDKLSIDDYETNYILKDAICVIKAEVISMEKSDITDKYGKNSITNIVSRIIDISIKNNQITGISRATGKIIDLLIDYTRYNFMNNSQKTIFMDKVCDIEDFVNKTGNDNHVKSLKIIKKEIGLED